MVAVVVVILNWEAEAEVETEGLLVGLNQEVKTEILTEDVEQSVLMDHELHWGCNGRVDCLTYRTRGGMYRLLHTPILC